MRINDIEMLIVRGLNALREMGGVVFESLRDPNEPNVEQKEAFDLKLFKALNRVFSKQKAAVLSYVLENYGETGGISRKAAKDVLNFEFEDWSSEVYSILLAILKAGALEFHLSEALQVEYSLINPFAIEAAQKLTSELVARVDKTTAEAVSRAIEMFIKTPGMTMGDLEDMLPFDPPRAFSIARTEVTAAYATGMETYGHVLMEQYPDIQIVKLWYTNRDDKVCPICAPLHGKVVQLNSIFGFFNSKSGVTNINLPPAHVNCRCWIGATTNISGLTVSGPIEIHL